MVINWVIRALQQPSQRFNIAALLVIVLVALSTGCQQLSAGTRKSPSSTPPAASVNPAYGDLVQQLAQVDSVAAQVSPLDPAKADITISGLLHDGATRVQDIQQQKLADGFVITVTTARPKNATASLALIPFDRTISVSLAAMPKGLCKVMANGVATTFMIP